MRDRGDQEKKPSVGATRSRVSRKALGLAGHGCLSSSTGTVCPVSNCKEEKDHKVHAKNTSYFRLTTLELKGLPGWVPSPRMAKGTGPRSISEGIPHSPSAEDDHLALHSLRNIPVIFPVSLLLLFCFINKL